MQLDDFDTAKFIEDVANRYSMVGMWFCEDCMPILDSANKLYDDLNIANMDLPISAHEMITRS